MLQYMTFELHQILMYTWNKAIRREREKWAIIREADDTQDNIP